MLFQHHQRNVLSSSSSSSSFLSSFLPYNHTQNDERRHDTVLICRKKKRCSKKNFPGAKVRYGDSVTPDTPLLVRRGGIIETCRIDTLVNDYVKRDDGKEIGFIHADVWTESPSAHILDALFYCENKKP